MTFLPVVRYVDSWDTMRSAAATNVSENLTTLDTIVTIGNYEQRELIGYNVMNLQQKKTVTSMRKKESQYGVRYSVLLALRYFDPVKFTVIDPMHNLLLGTGKHVFKVWMDLRMFTTAQLKEFESTIKEFQTPADIGRLPSRIGSEYNGFTANQWYNWITIYSPVVLKGVLPDTHLRCWLLYVRAGSILNSRYITESSISSADLFLLHFVENSKKYMGQSIALQTCIYITTLRIVYLTMVPFTLSGVMLLNDIME